MTYWYEILFYAVFLCQIFLISWSIPRSILRRMKKVLTDYPPKEYPKLYPKSRDFYVAWHTLFEVATVLIFLLGLGIIYLLLFVVDHATFASDGYISEIWPVAYGALQFAPIAALSFLEYNTTKLMRVANSNSTRKADLRPRRLFDFVHPILFGASIIAFITVGALDLFAHASSGLIIWLIVGQAVFAGSAAVCLYGKKQNPHQTPEDRNRQLKPALQSLVFGSLAMSIYFATVILDDIYDLDYLDATLISAYFQVIAIGSIVYILRNVALTEINFDVYRRTPNTDSV